jgi:hypothetical protein
MPFSKLDLSMWNWSPPLTSSLEPRVRETLTPLRLWGPISGLENLLVASDPRRAAPAKRFIKVFY